MAADLVVQGAGPIVREYDPRWEENMDLIRSHVAQGATPAELRLFLYSCQRAGLDPLLKQIYYIKRKGKGTIQVAIDGLRLIAERTGRYAGADEPQYMGKTETGYPEIARVTIYKMVAGQRCPFSASARWDEYYPGDDQGFQWRRMPHVMLGKCAEALALRRAFPADMSGLYVMEEMAQAGPASGTGGEPAPPDAPALTAPSDEVAGEVVGEEAGPTGWDWYVSIGGNAIGRAEILDRAKALDRKGAELVNLARVEGCATPEDVANYVRGLKDGVGHGEEPPAAAGALFPDDPAPTPVSASARAMTGDA